MNLAKTALASMIVLTASIGTAAPAIAAPTDGPAVTGDQCREGGGTVTEDDGGEIEADALEEAGLVSESCAGGEFDGRDVLL